ncbi:MAG: glycosyltransferase [Bacteroidia bacterium]|nr:glycosyltransferase [Bacteroidia bacterium]MDW8088370.1 glycosyltransferase [Bacteroidia bacterium]
MNGWEIAFWVGFILLLYPYGLYPLGLWVGAAFRRPLKQSESSAELPPVTVVIPAYREAHSVRPKMESLRQLDYPKDKLRLLWVISTHAEDETLEPTLAVLRAYPEAEYRLIPHRGKNYALNQARQWVDTSYVLLTDADTPLAPQSLRKAMAKMLADPEVGIVGGSRAVQPAARTATVGGAEQTYLAYENRLRAWESLWGCALGLGGGFLLLRRAVWEELPEKVGDDLYLNLTAGWKGWKVLLEPEAIAYEIPSPDPRAEFARKVRIAYTAWHTLPYVLSLSALIRRGRFTFFFLSHKFFRYLVAPLALFGMGLAAMVCMLEGKLGYALGVVGVGGASVQALLLYSGLRPTYWLGRWLFLPGYFVLAHVAQLVGLWQVLRGTELYQLWQRPARSVPQSVSL